MIFNVNDFKSFNPFQNNTGKSLVSFNNLNKNLLVYDFLFLKSGNKIHIKKENRGKFTQYCGGKVTSECILRGKHSSNPKIRKRATFAANARKWKHSEGGKIFWNDSILKNLFNGHK